MNRLIEFLFGCSHKRTTFPQSARGAAYATCSCIGCGKEFVYSWRDMKIVEPAPAHDYSQQGRAARLV